MDPTWTLGAAISNKARVRFLPMGGTAVPVREEIGDSSRRSLTSGVQPDQLDVPYDPTRTRGNAWRVPPGLSSINWLTISPTPA
jgi:hypothetical protein